MPNSIKRTTDVARSSDHTGEWYWYWGCRIVNMLALLALLRLIDVFIDTQTFSVPKIITYPKMKLAPGRPSYEDWWAAVIVNCVCVCVFVSGALGYCTSLARTCPVEYIISTYTVLGTPITMYSMLLCREERWFSTRCTFGKVFWTPKQWQKKQEPLFGLNGIPKTEIQQQWTTSRQ